MKLLVCGDRNWTNIDIIRRELSALPREVKWTIIHGDCRGADKLAGQVAKELGFEVIPVLAEWKKYGKAAGVIRNRKMYDEQKPDMVLAFHEHIEDSKGTKDMIAYTEQNKGIWRLVTK